MSTVVYLIRHSESKKIKIKKNHSFLELTKKVHLSRKGKKIARDFSNNKNLKDIDVLISSDYNRAIETARFLGKNYEINNMFGERIYGVEDFNDLPINFEEKQVLDENYKLENGESQKEVRNRMYDALIKVLNKHKGKKIAIVSHSTAITFLLTKWCEIKYRQEYKYKGFTFFNGDFLPCTSFKLVFDDNNKLESIELLKTEIKVMSFNLRHIIKEEIIGVWKKRYERIVTFIKNESPDIIGVQELTRKGKRYLKN